MATDRQNQYITPLVPLLTMMAKVEPDILIQKERLGSEFSFEKAVPIATAIVSSATALLKSDLEAVPYSILNSLLNVFKQFESIFTQMIHFAPAQHGNAAQARDSFIQQLEDHWGSIYSTVQAVLNSNTSDLTKREFDSLAGQVKNAAQLASEATKLMEAKQVELSAKLDEFLEQKKIEFESQSSEKFEDINLALDSVRSAAAEVGVSQNSIYFHQEAREHNTSARRWLLIATLLAVALVAFGFWGTRLLELTGTNEPSVDAVFIIQLRYFIQKGLIVFGLIYALILATRNYSSAKHNYVVNKHRNNALSSFQAFVSGSADEQTKSAVLIQATQSIFAPQPSGYIKVDGENTAQGSIVEILRTVGGIKDKS